MSALLDRSRLIIRCVTYPPVKNLTRYFMPFAGRNNTGKVTFISKTRRVKRLYRLIDFKRLIWNCIFIPLRVEYDPNRSAFVLLICYLNGILSYVISSHGIFFGDGDIDPYKYFVGHVPDGLQRKIRVGFILPLYQCNEGAFLNTVEMDPSFGGTVARAAGTSIILMKKLTKDYYLTRLPSKERVLIASDSVGNLGFCSNINRKYTIYQNAGQRRRLGWKPKVRGVAMNPIDHPHGGGGGKHLVTPWALVAKTVRTRDPKKLSPQIIRSRRLAIRRVVIVKLKKMKKQKKEV